MSEYPEDDLSFFAEMGDVRPLNQDKVNSHSARRTVADKQRQADRMVEHNERTQVPLALENISAVAPDDFLAFKQPGIQEGVYKNLRLGKYTLDQSLTLSGLNLQQSAVAFYKGLTEAHNKGQRVVLIRHGKGDNSKPFPAFKKSYVNHWLQQMPEVIAYHTAQPVHGGLGATYVLLKKHPEQKQINREKNRRR